MVQAKQGERHPYRHGGGRVNLENREADEPYGEHHF
jgi:hypothetical protein